MISPKSLLRQIGLQAVIVLTFGWRTAVSAQNNTYCTCVADTCKSGACDYKGCAENFPEGYLLGCNHPINLLAPLNDVPGSSITTTSGQPFEAFKAYFNIAWPWLLGCAAGVAVFWALIGGIEIMLSGSDTGLRDRGKGRFLSALAGLLIIGLSGLILQILNPIGFTQ